jgi:tetratricopeptide (TPR) repeat protein
VLVKLQRPAEALPVARRAEELDPESSIAHRLVSRILNDLGQAQEAAREDSLARTAAPEKYEVDSDVAKYYETRAPTKSSVTAPALHSLDPGTSSSDLQTLAERAMQEGDVGVAISHYQDALAHNSVWERGWTNLGILLYTSDRLADAILALTNSLSLNRSQADAWVFLGLSEFEIKDYQNAFLHLERGRELGFHGTEQAKKTASYTLAQLRNLNGDFDGALDLLTSSIEANQLAGPIKVVLGMALLHIPLVVSQVELSRSGLLESAGETAFLLRQQKYDEAFEHFDTLLKNFPNTPFLHFAYGAALQTFSRFDEAEKQFQEETRITPKSALPRLRLSQVALTQHHPEEAAASAREAVALDHDSGGAHELLGRTLLELGKIEDSVRELEIANRLAPTYPEVHFDLARAYAKAKRIPEAERERAIFAQMNASTEREGVHRSNSAYGSPRDSSISERGDPKPGSTSQ